MSDHQLRLPDARLLARPALASLLAVLDQDGEEARVVGGAVRNVLLGHPPDEIDVATTAEPAEVVRRVEMQGFRAIPTGIAHGTITVVIEGSPFEVTTLRQDVETFGRKARVRFGRDWKADAERRDFTMNALSASREGIVYDYVGGVADLRAHVVRFIGDPARRIAEDYLRILRFFRFYAAYGRGEPDAAALAACIAAREGLDRLSRERVRMELLKLVAVGGPVPAVTIMAQAGLLGPVIGGVPQLCAFAAMVALEAALELGPDAIRRLGALAVFTTEDATRLWHRLRLANSEYERLISMAQSWWRVSAELGSAEAQALLYRLGPERFIDRVLLAWARSGAPAKSANWHALLSLPQRWTAPAFPLKAADLMDCGVAKGPQLGKALAAAKERWIALGFPVERATLAAIADAAARELE
jgi:poly(A) polymerase